MKRRTALQGLAATACPPWVTGDAIAEPNPALHAAIQSWIGRRTVVARGIRLDVAEIVENGHDVPVRVEVDSAMAGNDRVEMLSLWTPANPQALAVLAHFGPHTPKAALALRIRLATSQRLTALALMADGSVRRADVPVIVSLAACIEA